MRNAQRTTFRVGGCGCRVETSTLRSSHGTTTPNHRHRSSPTLSVSTRVRTSQTTPGKRCKKFVARRTSSIFQPWLEGRASTCSWIIRLKRCIAPHNSRSMMHLFSELFSKHCTKTGSRRAPYVYEAAVLDCRGAHMMRQHWGTGHEPNEKSRIRGQ